MQDRRPSARFRSAHSTGRQQAPRRRCPGAAPEGRKGCLRGLTEELRPGPPWKARMSRQVGRCAIGESFSYVLPCVESRKSLICKLVYNCLSMLGRRSLVKRQAMLDVGPEFGEEIGDCVVAEQHTVAFDALGRRLAVGIIQRGKGDNTDIAGDLRDIE